MKNTMLGKISLAFSLILLAGTISSASAAGGDLGVANTALGNIIVDGKGMTAYYFDKDVQNSGASACTGGCLTHWPIISAATSTPMVSGINAAVTLISGSNQIEINGRPIYTFAGDQKSGDTNGQGVGGVWYVVSPEGVEMTPAVMAKSMTAPATSPSPAASQKYGKKVMTSSRTSVKSPIIKLVAHATGSQVSMTANSNKGGAAKGTAEAVFRISTKTDRLCYTVTTSGLAGVVAGHIHKGATGVDGGVEVALNSAKFNKGTACMTVAKTILTDITKSPDMYYFNLHTKEFSAGAVRGQLMLSK